MYLTVTQPYSHFTSAFFCNKGKFHLLTPHIMLYLLIFQYSSSDSFRYSFSIITIPVFSQAVNRVQ